MPTEIIKTEVVSDGLVDPWTHVWLDKDLDSDETIVAIPVNALDQDLDMFVQANGQMYNPQPASSVLANAGSAVAFVDAADNGWEIHPKSDSPTHARMCRVNRYTNGVIGYALAVRKGTSAPFTYSAVPDLRHPPRIDNVSKTQVSPGDWIVVAGRNFHAPLAGGANRSGLFLVDSFGVIVNPANPGAGTSPPWDLPLYEFFEANADPYFFKAVKIPAGLANGQYRLVAHNGMGGNAGWSNERVINVVTAPTVPSNRQTVVWDPNPATCTQNLKNAIAALPAGGGHLVVPGETYELTERIVLKANMVVYCPAGKATFKRAPSFFSAAGEALFQPADNVTFRNIVFAPRSADTGSYTFFGGTGGRDMKFLDCEFRDGVIGEWNSQRLFINRCRFDKASINQFKSEILVWDCDFSRVGPHAIFTWECRDALLVNLRFDNTDRGLVIQPLRGSVTLFTYRLQFNNISQVVNGGEHLCLEGGNSWQSGSFTMLNPTRYRLEFAPSQAINAGLTHAVWRYDGKTVEARRIISTELETVTGKTIIVLDAPRRSMRGTTLELVWAPIDCTFLQTRVVGGKGPGVAMFFGFAFGNLFHDYHSDGGAGVYAIKYPSNANNTQVMNTFSLFELHDTQWTAGFDIAGSTAMEMFDPSIFHLESSAKYNLICNVLVDGMAVGNSTQLFWTDTHKRYTTPAAFRSAGGTDAGNVAQRGHVRESLPHDVLVGVYGRNVVTDHRLRSTTFGSFGADMTLDGDRPSINNPGNRLRAPLGLAVTYDLLATAVHNGGATWKRFNRRFTVENNGGTTTVVGITTPDADEPTSGAPSWTLTVQADDPNDAVRFVALPTGVAAGQRVEWEGRLTEVSRVPL